MANIVDINKYRKNRHKQQRARETGILRDELIVLEVSLLIFVLLMVVMELIGGGK